MVRCSSVIFIRVDTVITSMINLICVLYISCIMSFWDIHVGVNSAVTVI